MTPSACIPLVLLIAGPPVGSDFQINLVRDVPTAILVPTADTLTAGVRAEALSQENVILNLDDVVVADDGGQLELVTSCETLLAPLRDSLVETERSKRVWVLPPSAQWGDLVLDLIEEQALNAKFRNETRRFEPHDLGMANRKNGNPTKAWTLLALLAAHGGVLGWDTPNSTLKVKKRKQILADKLRSAFGIPAQPIVWRANAYRTVFTLRDSRPKRVRESFR